MEKYIFKSKKINNEYRYIFLCGTKFSDKIENDKRVVLRKFLQETNLNYIPIILEDNFVFRKNKSKHLSYDDIHMKDLYSVEMVVNYLADNNIIIHESISTGAEIGLFLSVEEALKKTCILLPDSMAIEEDKLGGFLRLAFRRQIPKLKVITFYPRIENNIVSINNCNWHTYFNKNKVGNYLGSEIRKFINGTHLNDQITFTKSKKEVSDGKIHYSVKAGKLVITAKPRVIMLCICTLFNIKEFRNEIINCTPDTLSKYVSKITEWLKQIFVNTLEEITGEDIIECRIVPEMYIRKVYISHIIGMCLYLMQAAEFIQISKYDNYLKTKKVVISRKILSDMNGKNIFFYEKYKDCISKAIKRKVL